MASSAADRTERATPKRRQEARKKGQIARSQEVNTAVVLMATVGALAVFGPRMLTNLENVVRDGLISAEQLEYALAEKEQTGRRLGEIFVSLGWVAAGEHGFWSVVVTEQEEPQAVLGSTLHRLAFPDDFTKHVNNNWQLKHAHEHPDIDIGEKLLHPFRKPEILQVQPRGEYLYAACGEGGLRVEAEEPVLAGHLPGLAERSDRHVVEELGPVDGGPDGRLGHHQQPRPMRADDAGQAADAVGGDTDGDA